MTFSRSNGAEACQDGSLYRARSCDWAVHSVTLTSSRIVHLHKARSWSSLTPRPMFRLPIQRAVMLAMTSTPPRISRDDTPALALFLRTPQMSLFLPPDSDQTRWPSISDSRMHALDPLPSPCRCLRRGLALASSTRALGRGPRYTLCSLCILILAGESYTAEALLA